MTEVKSMLLRPTDRHFARHGRVHFSLKRKRLSFRRSPHGMVEMKIILRRDNANKES